MSTEKPDLIYRNIYDNAPPELYNKNHNYTFKFNLKDVILIYLRLYNEKDLLNRYPETKKGDLKKTIGYLEANLLTIKAHKVVEETENYAQIELTIVTKKKDDTKVAELFKKPYVETLLHGLLQNLLTNPDADLTFSGLINADKQKLHKQPRNYLKTIPRLVGKATDEPTLFTMPEVKLDNGGNVLREVISRNTAILGNYLLQLWQERGQDELEINNLSPLSEMMNVNNYEIKIYLLYLGGYTYPIVDKNEKGGLTLTTEQLFKIKFHYGKKVKDKYTSGGLTEIGGGLTKFIKDEPVESITIKPSPLFIKAIEGKGLGNVLVVNDKFIKLALSLETDIAYKILSYTASNRPTQKIAEDNLIKHLGLEKQIKAQGRPRVRATILKGLQELQDKEHIKNYSYEDETGMYLFTYSDTFIKHKESLKDKKEA